MTFTGGSMDEDKDEIIFHRGKHIERLSARIKELEDEVLRLQDRLDTIERDDDEVG